TVSRSGRCAAMSAGSWSDSPNINSSSPRTDGGPTREGRCMNYPQDGSQPDYPTQPGYGSQAGYPGQSDYSAQPGYSVPAGYQAAGGYHDSASARPGPPPTSAGPSRRSSASGPWPLSP